MLNANPARIDRQVPPRFKTMIGFFLFLGFGIAAHGILLSVEYRWTKVLDVTAMAGRSENDRVVLLDTPDRVRVVRIADPFVATPKGAQVCVAKRRIFARRWLMHRIVLPGFCRGQPRLPPAQSVFRVD
jgi:hypothetical protein